MKIRNKLPIRNKEIKPCNNYHDYRQYLEVDFSHHCGYCGDCDKPRRNDFEIDHFIPKKIMKSIRENDYSNLVYSCRSCNNSKRAKWPTKDELVCNDGHCGWIDPCDPRYDEQFDRDESGNILPKTELGKWMYDNLKLFKSQHRLLWSFEQFDIIMDEMQKYINQSNDIDLLKKFIDLYRIKKSIFDEFYQ